MMKYLSIIPIGMVGAFMVLAACSSDTTTSGVTPDGGGVVTNPDGGTVSIPDGQAVCSTSGFQTAVKLGDFGYEYANVSMALDANDEPTVAFIGYDHDDRTQSYLYFASYDPAKCAWNAPVKVDLVGGVNDNPTLREVQLVRDPSNNQLGIAYYVQTPHDNPSPNGDLNMKLAQSADSGKTWTSEVVARDELAYADPTDVDTHYLDFPVVAMAAGRTIYAYYRNFDLQESCGSAHSFCNSWTVLTRTGTTGAWSGGQVSASTALPYAGGESMSAALAIDPTGVKAGFAWYSRNNDDDPTLVINYLEVGKTQAVKVFDSSGTANDQPALSLTFDRNQPRIVATLMRSTTDTGSSTWFSSSADGVTWAAPLEIPADHTDGESMYVSIAANQSGGLTIAGDYTGAAGDHGTGGGPKLSTATNLTTFTTTGADPDGDHVVGYAGDYVQVSYTKSGKRVLAFRYESSTAPGLDAGVVVWREP